MWSHFQAIPAPGHGALVGYCDTSAHCDVGECCVSFNQLRGRRVVLITYDPHLMSLVHGHCAYRGTTGDSNLLVVTLYFYCIKGNKKANQSQPFMFEYP